MLHLIYNWKLWNDEWLMGEQDQFWEPFPF